jgi:sugar lactone lactonase YvrE
MAYPPITTLPAAPSRNDPDNFSTEADAFVAALPALVTETNTAGVYTAGQATAAAQSVVDAAAEVVLAADEVALATTQAGNAATSADEAAASAAAAVVTANAAEWVSEASYAEFANVISPVDFGTYRAKTTHTGVATDPSADATNWVVISARTLASQAVAEAGTDNTASMSPLRTAQAIAANTVDVTLATFQRATAISDTFTVQYAKTTTDAGVVSMYKEVASAAETSNVFSATAASTAFEFDATKLAFTGGSLGLKVVGTAGFAISGGSYDSVSFSVASEDANPLALAFNADGTKMFIVGDSGRELFQYTLSTAFDLSTASYDSVSFSVNAQATGPNGVAFNTDGTKMYVSGANTDSVFQYTLSTGFDLSTASYDSVSFSVSGQDTAPVNVTFNTDGTKMYMVGETNNSVFQYTLSTGFDLSTASYDSVSFSVASEDVNPRDVAFNTDGTKMFVVGVSNDSVFQYTLSTAFDLSTASYDSVSFSVTSEDTNPQSIAFSTDGTKMYMVGSTSDSVYQYSTVTDVYTANEYLPAITSNPLDTEFWTELTSMTASDTANGQSAFYAFSSDSRASWLIMELGGTAERTIARNNAGTWEYNSNVTYGSETWVSASVNTESDALSEAMSVAVNRMGRAFGSVPYDLTTAIYDSVSFSVAGQDTEVMSVTFSTNGTKMFVVGDFSSGVDQYTLSTGFDLSTASHDSVYLSFNGQDNNPQDVSFNTAGTKMYMVGYSSDAVYQYTLSTAFDLSTASYDSVSFSVSSQDTNPHGIAFNTDGTKMFMVGSVGDSVYQYTLSTGFDLSTASYDSVSYSVNSEDTQPKTIEFNADGTKMFIGGYTNSKVYQYTLSTGFDVSTASYDSVSFSVFTEDAQLQGIAFSADGTKMYIAGDNTNTIYQYSTATYPTYTALADSLNEAVILHTTDTSVTPSYAKTAINYDANAQYTLLAPVTDYDVKLGTNQATITSKVAGNIKGRIV